MPALPTNPRLISSNTPLPIPTPTRVPEATAAPTATPAPSIAPTTQPSAQPTPDPPTDGRLNELRGTLEGLIGKWAGKHAVSVTDLQTGQTIAVNGSRPQLAACTVKIVIMMAVAQHSKAGRYSEADVAALVQSAMGPSNTAPARELLARIGGGDIGAGLRRVNEIMWNLGANQSIITHPPGYH